MSYPDPALAAALKHLRTQHGIAQQHLAHEAGITASALSRIERGLANPGWPTIRRLAETLDTSLAELGAIIDRETSQGL